MSEKERFEKITIMLQEFALDYKLQYPDETLDLGLVINIVIKNYPKEK